MQNDKSMIDKNMVWLIIINNVVGIIKNTLYQIICSNYSSADDGGVFCAGWVGFRLLYINVYIYFFN